MCCRVGCPAVYTYISRSVRDGKASDPEGRRLGVGIIDVANVDRFCKWAKTAHIAMHESMRLNKSADWVLERYLFLTSTILYVKDVKDGYTGAVSRGPLVRS